MRFSKTLIPTLKEIPNDVDVDNISQVLMSRSGLIRRMSNGLYVYMPLMNMVMSMVEAEIRRGMSSVDCFEVKFPTLVQAEALVESGRWSTFGDIMFRLKDRTGKDMAMSPTNEEAACFMARAYIQSHNQLPFSLYQIQKKYRDEIRPKGGVMRTREFTMKDAYSFHATEADLANYFLKMQKAYNSIFKNLGIKTVTVSADMGVMGGNYSREIMALSTSGTDTVAMCPRCKFAENIEILACVDNSVHPKAKGTPEKIHTPNVKTIEELCKFMKCDATNFCKSIIYETEQGFVVALVGGNYEINDIKLRKALGVKELELADKQKAEKQLKTVIGFVGPVGLVAKNSNVKFRVIADNSLRGMSNFIVGANEADYHLKNVNVSNFECAFADIRLATENDICPNCAHSLTFSKAYELGHIFALGQHYTKKLGLTYVNEHNQDELLWMGCYGIGVERTIAAIIEQHSDANGIAWPAHVAPVDVNIITVYRSDEEQTKTSEAIYKKLLKKGVSVLWDDRNVSVGIKFKDSDLIGIPFKVVVGKNITMGKVEIVERDAGTTPNKREVEIEKAVATIERLVKEKISKEVRLCSKS